MKAANSVSPSTIITLSPKKISETLESKTIRAFRLASSSSLKLIVSDLYILGSNAYLIDVNEQ